LTAFIRNLNIETIYIDPSASSFIQECRQQGMNKIQPANNSVLDGIRFVTSLLDNGTLKICSSCLNTIREFQSYVWDDKATLKGEDKPMKTNDHCFIAGTMITTNRGQVPIERVTLNDKVLTRLGYKDVLLTHDHLTEVKEYNILGNAFTCTPEHKFFTANRGFIECRDLIHSDIILINKPKELERWPLLSSTVLNTETTPKVKTILIQNIIDSIKPTPLKDMVTSIETFTSYTMEKYLQNVMFITSTEIPKTMILATSDYYQQKNIIDIIQIILQNSRNKQEEIIPKESDHLTKNGIEARRGELGTERTLKELQRILSLNNITANSAGKSSSSSLTEQSDFVRISVKVNGEETLALIMRLESVFNAEKNLLVTNTQSKSYVLKNAPGHIEKVYNLTVDSIPEFFANNILVHNCLDSVRYACMHFFNGTGSMTPQDLNTRYRKALGLDDSMPAFFRSY